MTGTNKYAQLTNPSFVGAQLIEQIDRAYENEGGFAAEFAASAKHRGWSPVTLTYISDNGNYADLAKAEIEKRLTDIDRKLAVVSDSAPTSHQYHDIPSMNWISGAVDTAQLARDTVRGPGNIIFVNCAPRLAQRGKEGNNKGEEVYVAMLRNGTVISGVSAHSFAFVRDLVENDDLEIYKANVQIDGSQFRSRDFFPWYSKILAHNLAQKPAEWKRDLSVERRREFLEQFNVIDTSQKVALDDIPDLKKNIQVARVDTHGNLKLSISLSDAIENGWANAERKPDGKIAVHGEPLEITVKNLKFKARIVDSMFNTQNGERGVAQGSSGNWPDSAQEFPRFLELAIIGASLRDHLDISHQELKDGLSVIIRKDEKPAFKELQNRNNVSSHPEPPLSGVN
jgi:hypothetical protein